MGFAKFRAKPELNRLRIDRDMRDETFGKPQALMPVKVVFCIFPQIHRELMGCFGGPVRRLGMAILEANRREHSGNIGCAKCNRAIIGPMFSRRLVGNIGRPKCPERKCVGNISLN